MSENSTAAQAIESLGISVEEAIETDRHITGLTRGKRRDNRVCICGHAMTRHVEQDGVSRCFPSRMACVCQGTRPVLEVSDTRLFLRKTTGPGKEHALLRGLSALVLKGGEASWIENLSCELCGVDATTENISPVPLSISGKICYNESQLSGKHAFLCRPCIEEVGR